MGAAQALSHPWIKNHNDVTVQLDILIFKHMKAYMCSSSLRKAGLRALAKTLTVDELLYLKEQLALLEPNKNGTINLENIKAVGFVSIFYLEDGVYCLTNLSPSGLDEKCNRCYEGVTHSRLSGIT